MYRVALLAAVTEFGPLIVFFILGNWYGFMAAVAGLLVATITMLILSLVALRKLPYFALLSTLFVVIESSLTLWLQIPLIFLLTDASFYLVVTLVLGYSLWRGHPLLQTLFGHVFALTPAGWQLLTNRWTICFGLCVITNAFAIVLLTPEEWINYRTIRTLLIAGFGLWQFKLSARCRDPQAADRWGIRTTPPSPQRP